MSYTQPAVTSNSEEAGMARPLSVGIIGAGMAGLRCAEVLIQSGIKVTILEARDRIGGRVAQSSHLGRGMYAGELSLGLLT